MKYALPAALAVACLSLAACGSDGKFAQTLDKVQAVVAKGAAHGKKDFCQLNADAQAKALKDLGLDQSPFDCSKP